MNKKAQTKIKNIEADVPLKLEDLLNRLPKNVIAKETSKGHVLRHGKCYLMHVTQTSRGLHHFIRTKTGKHLESAYAVTEKDANSIIKEIEDKIKDKKIDEKIEKVGKPKPTSPPSSKIKNE